MSKKKCLMFALGIIFLLTSPSIKGQFVVTSIIDDPTTPLTGQLRYAITQANLASGATTISFNIPGTGEHVISLLATLPVLSKQITIDGTTQSGYVFGSPNVVIDGSLLTSLPIGITITSAPPCIIKGLYIRNFADGININFSNSCQVLNCVINRNPNRNLVINSSSSCIVKGNFINTDFARTKFIASPSYSQECIYFTNNGTTGSSSNIIGGTACNEGNVILYSGSEGIDNNPACTPGLNKFNTFSGNIIYGNRFDAIELRNAANNNLGAPLFSVIGCTTSGTAALATTCVGCTVELFGSDTPDKHTAKVFLKSTVLGPASTWTAALGIIQYPYITATMRDLNNHTSELATAVPITPNLLAFSFSTGSLCAGSAIPFTVTSGGCAGTTYLWDYGDGSGTTSSTSHTYASTGTYTVTLFAVGSPVCPQNSVSQNVTIISCTTAPCTDCIGSFSPEPGKNYIVSAWVKKEFNATTDVTYVEPEIYFDFPSLPSVGPFIASGAIIDGWQRVEAQFQIPPTATYITTRLNCKTGTCLFDDIRIFPVDGSMKSYVYDPVTLRLVAELDERNYATFYEYDEEGKLVRVKKETEKGIMTIKENKNSTNKK